MATFDSSASMYRIFDGEELARTLQTGKITGGTYSIKAERAHGASWGENLSAILSWGNSQRGGRLGDDLFLAKLDVLDKRFYHLNPEVNFDPSGPERQEVLWDASKCSLGLGCSIMDVSLGDVDLFRVEPNDQMTRISPAEAKALLKPSKPVDLRQVNSQLLQGSILGVDVRVVQKGAFWTVVLNDDRAIVTGAKTKDDAIELAQMSIRMRPERPVQLTGQILEQKRKHEKHFEVDEDPQKTRGQFDLKPRDKVVVTKGSRGLSINSRETGIVADVYQRAGEREIMVKILFGGKPVVLYAQHPNRLKDEEISLMNSKGDKILVRTKRANMMKVRVALRHKGRKPKDSVILAKKLADLDQRARKLRAKVKRDLRSSDPDQFMTALAVAMLEEVGHEVLEAKKRHIRLSDGEENPTSVMFKMTKGKARKIASPFLIQALMSAYQTVDADEDALFTHDLGRVTAAHVTNYLDKFGLTSQDLRGMKADSLLRESLVAARAAGPKLPRLRKARQKILRAEFEQALKEASEYVNLDAKVIRSEYIHPGLEAAYLHKGLVREKQASGSIAFRVYARAMGL